jgi:hypothetical protein
VRGTRVGDGDDVAGRVFDCGAVPWSRFGGGEGVNSSDELRLLRRCAAGDELRCCVADDELTFLPSRLTGDDRGGVGGCVLSS